MNYVELYIPVCDGEQSDIWMAELSDFPFDSFEQQQTCLKAYIPERELQKCRAEVDEFVRDTGVQCRFTHIEAENWNRIWESGFEPVYIGKRCVIRAPFHEPPDDVELDIVIMPKMSFGTGHHATTYLMTEQIIRNDFKGQRGLDMGSGTGVLAIIAAKRGAESVDAVDIDEWAYENCMENIAVNGVADRVKPALGDVSAIEGKSYGFILANINRNILLADMGRYIATLRKGGMMIVSGILVQDTPVITAKAESLGLSTHSQQTKEEWAAVAFVKE